MLKIEGRIKFLFCENATHRSYKRQAIKRLTNQQKKKKKERERERRGKVRGEKIRIDFGSPKETNFEFCTWPENKNNQELLPPVSEMKKFTFLCRSRHFLSIYSFSHVQFNFGKNP